MYTDDHSTLFRNDSMATKAARIFFSLIGKSYLKRMILSFVAYVTCEVGKGNSYEVCSPFLSPFLSLLLSLSLRSCLRILKVDSAKMKSSDDLPTNAARLIVAARKFLGPILDSCSELPVYEYHPLSLSTPPLPLSHFRSRSRSHSHSHFRPHTLLYIINYSAGALGCFSAISVQF